MGGGGGVSDGGGVGVGFGFGGDGRGGGDGDGGGGCVRGNLFRGGPKDGLLGGSDLVIAPGGLCSPRHRMQFESRNEGLNIYG